MRLVPSERASMVGVTGPLSPTSSRTLSARSAVLEISATARNRTGTLATPTGSRVTV